MTTVKCPKCKSNVSIDISKAADENAEVFVCEECGCKFRYAPNG